MGVQCDASGSVVGLRLANANLTGVLPVALATLDTLTVLDVSSNGLTYPASREELSAFQAATRRCRTGEAACRGLPPLSCSAFQGRYRLSLSDPLACEPCEINILAIVLMLSGGALTTLLVLVLFAVLVVRYPGALRRWISTVTIIINHTQSVAVLYAMRLDWPLSLKQAIALMSLDIMLSLPSSACLFDEDSPSPFWLYALGACSAVLTLDIALVVAYACAPSMWATRAELVLSLLFSLQLTVSWRVIANVLLSIAQGGWPQGAVPPITFSLAVALLIVQLGLAIHFFRRVTAFRRGARKGEWWVPRWLWSSRWKSLHGVGSNVENFRRVQPRHLEQSTAYLTARFNTSAPRWQLVIWARQLALTLLAFLIDLMHGQIVGSDGAADAQALATFGMVRYGFVGAALVTLLIFWRLHASSKPYYFMVQNSMESWLLCSNVVLVLLAIAYTAIGEATAVGTVEPPIRFGVEIALGIVLFGSLAVAAAFFAYDLRRQRRALRGIDLVAALDFAAEKIDRVAGKQLQRGSIRLLRCDWLLSARADSCLGHHGAGGKAVIKRYQDLPEEAFFSPQEANALLARCDRSVLVLSYGWQVLGHPEYAHTASIAAHALVMARAYTCLEWHPVFASRCYDRCSPYGTSLETIRHYLAATPNTKECGLFWE